MVKGAWTLSLDSLLYGFGFLAPSTWVETNCDWTYTLSFSKWFIHLKLLQNFQPLTTVLKTKTHYRENREKQSCKKTSKTVKKKKTRETYQKNYPQKPRLGNICSSRSTEANTPPQKPPSRTRPPVAAPPSHTPHNLHRSNPPRTAPSHTLTHTSSNRRCSRQPFLPKKFGDYIWIYLLLHEFYFYNLKIANDIFE